MSILKNGPNSILDRLNLRSLPLMSELDGFEVACEGRPLSDEEITLETLRRQDLDRIIKQEEIYWKKRARVTWIKEGDENTKFFHAVANGRRNRNFIPWVMHNNDRVDDEKRIGDVFTSFFHNLYGLTQEYHHQINWNTMHRPKTQHDLSFMDVPFT